MFNQTLLFLWGHIWFAADLIFPSPLLSVSPSEAFPALPSPAAHLGQGSGAAEPDKPPQEPTKEWFHLRSSQRWAEKPTFECIFLMPVQCWVSAPLKILIQVKCAGTARVWEAQKDFFPWNTRKASFLCTGSLFWAPALLWCVWFTATSHCILSALWNCLYCLGYIYQEKKIHLCGRANTHISHAIPSPPPHQADLCISLFQKLFYYIWCPSSAVWFIPELLSTKLALINQTTLMGKWENETGLVTAVIFSNPGVSHISLNDSFQNQKENLENTSKSELLLKCCFTPEYQKQLLPS